MCVCVYVFVCMCGWATQKAYSMLLIGTHIDMDDGYAVGPAAAVFPAVVRFATALREHGLEGWRLASRPLQRPMV